MAAAHATRNADSKDWPVCVHTYVHANGHTTHARIIRADECAAAVANDDGHDRNVGGWKVFTRAHAIYKQSVLLLEI